MMTDLFGNNEASRANAQMSLFGDSGDRIPHPAQTNYSPDPERVRVKLHALLETARTAEKMPWDARKAGMWQIVFPQMANWLPDDERDQLCFAFAEELERLKLAA